jgi:hypothetical protein
LNSILYLSFGKFFKLSVLNFIYENVRSPPPVWKVLIKNVIQLLINIWVINFSISYFFKSDI